MTRHVLVLALVLLLAVLVAGALLYIQRPAIQPIWSYETGDKVWSVGMSADGSYIGAGSYDNKIYLFSRTNGRPIWTYQADTIVRCVSVSSDGSYIAVGTGGGVAAVPQAGGLGGKVYLFSRSDNTPLWSYQSGAINYVSVSSDGSYVVAGSSDNKVYLFSRDGTLLWSYETGGTIWQTSISSDGGYIAAGSYDGKVYLFSRLDNAPLWIYDTGSPLSFVNGISMSSDGSYIAAVGGEIGKWAPSPYHKLYLFSRSSSTPIWSYKFPYPGISVAISSDGSHIIARCSGESKEHFRAYLFSQAENTPLWSFDGILGIAISSDGSFVAGGGLNAVYLFSENSGKPLWSYPTDGEVWSVEISSDGRYIAAGSLDHKVYVFDRERV